MPEIPLDAVVACVDGEAGTSSAILMNRWTRRVTGLVVEDRGFAHVERLVPVDRLTATGPDTIELNCAASDLETMERFRETTYLRSPGPENQDSESNADAALVEPFGDVEGEYLQVVEERVPRGEVAIERGMAVEASDGGVGRVAGLPIDAIGGHVTHLMVTEHHVFRVSRVAVPLEAVQRVGTSTIHVRLDRDAFHALPAPPIERPAG